MGVKMEVKIGTKIRCQNRSENQYVVFAHWMMWCPLHRSGLDVYNGENGSPNGSQDGRHNVEANWEANYKL